MFYGGNGSRKEKPVAEVELGSRLRCCFGALTAGLQHGGILKLMPVKNNLCFGSYIIYFFMGVTTVLSVFDLLCSKKARRMAKVPSVFLVVTLREERKYLKENLNLG